MRAARRLVARSAVPTPVPEEGEIDAEETKDLSDLSGLLRSGRRGAIYEIV